MGENELIAATHRSCRGVSELECSLFSPVITLEKLFSKLRLSIMTHNNHNAANVQYFIDCQLGRHDRKDEYNKDHHTYHCYNNKNNSGETWREKCYGYGRKCCCSSKHSDDE